MIGSKLSMGDIISKRTQNRYLWRLAGATRSRGFAGRPEIAWPRLDEGEAALPWPSGALTDCGHRRTTVATETIQSPALNVGCPSSQESPDWSSQLAAAVRRRRARLVAVRLVAVRLVAVRLVAVRLAPVGLPPPGPPALRPVALRLAAIRLVALNWGATGRNVGQPGAAGARGLAPGTRGRFPVRAEDALFLYADTPQTPQQVGAVALLGEPPLSLADLRSGVTERLNAIPDLRRRLVLASSEWRRPQWVVDNFVDVDRRVQQVTLEDAGCETLEELVSQFFSDPLDPFDSPWEMLLVRGLPSAPPLFEGPSMKPVGQHASAVVVKIHHSLGDSFTLIGALGTLLDQDGGGPGRELRLNSGRLAWACSVSEPAASRATSNLFRLKVRRLYRVLGGLAGMVCSGPPPWRLGARAERRHEGEMKRSSDRTPQLPDPRARLEVAAFLSPARFRTTYRHTRPRALGATGLPGGTSDNWSHSACSSRRPEPGTQCQTSPRPPLPRPPLPRPPLPRP